MVEEINNWIRNGSNYQQGLSLYDKYGSSAFFKNVLKRGETSANRQKLNELLVSLRDAQIIPVPVEPVVSPIPKTFTPVAVDLPAPRPKLLLPVLLQVTKQRDQTMAELRGLHPYLSTTGEGEELRAIAKRIVELGKKNAELWQRYNYLTEHPDEPDQAEKAPAPEPVMIDLNLVKKREQIRKNLSKAQNRIKNTVKPKANTLALIERLKAELKEIDARIAEIKKGPAA